MCSIVGVTSDKENVCLTIYNALTVLLNIDNGDAAGMATVDNNNNLNMHKNNGLVRDAFNEDSMIKLEGSFGVGHTRDPTAGSHNFEEAQPFYVNSPYGIVLIYNGNLVNVDKLRKELSEDNLRHLNTLSDFNILNIFAHALEKIKNKNCKNPIFLKQLMKFMIVLKEHMLL